MREMAHGNIRDLKVKQTEGRFFRLAEHLKNRVCVRESTIKKLVSKKKQRGGIRF